MWSAAVVFFFIYLPPPQIASFWRWVVTVVTFLLFLFTLVTFHFWLLLKRQQLLGIFQFDKPFIFCFLLKANATTIFCHISKKKSWNLQNKYFRWSVYWIAILITKLSISCTPPIPNHGHHHWSSSSYSSSSSSWWPSWELREDKCPLLPDAAPSLGKTPAGFYNGARGTALNHHTNQSNKQGVLHSTTIQTNTTLFYIFNGLLHISLDAMPIMEQGLLH